MSWNGDGQSRFRNAITGLTYKIRFFNLDNSPAGNLTDITLVNDLPNTVELNSPITVTIPEASNVKYFRVYSYDAGIAELLTFDHEFPSALQFDVQGTITLSKFDILLGFSSPNVVEY